MTFSRRRILSATGAAGAALLGLPAGAQTAAGLIRIGSTLALTGPLSATALTHKLVGEIYVEQLNKRGGLLGRQVQWIVKDDQSKPDLARTLYEQLVTSDKVDLLMGPYATGAILSAMGVAQRYNKVLVHHTFGIPSLAKYDMQFPAWSLGPNPQVTVSNSLFDMLAASAKPPKTIAIVTSKFPSIHFMSLGGREIAKKRGLNEVLFLEWDFGNRDFGPIAARVKDAKPDLVWIGDIGLEGNMLLDAMKKIDYVPPIHFHLYPA
ncbi:MAG TPA: ABC transporter substrate-binding protein, partial [Ramlibacter sp.]